MTWRTLKIADLADVASGGGAPQNSDAFGSEGIPFVRAGSLPRLLAGATEESLELLTPEVAAEHKLKKFPAGTVLFAKSGMSATKGHIYQLKNPAYVVNHLAALTPKSKVAGDYLRQVLQFRSPTCLIKDEAYPSIRLSDIKEMEVPAPEDDAGKERIISILNVADELRQKRQRAIDRLNELGEAIFHEMFGDPARNTKGLPLMPLGELCRIRRGGSPRPIDKFLGGNIPWIKIGDATKGDPFYLWKTKERIIEEGVSKSTFVEEGSLIFANCGVSLGFARITKIAGCIHDGWLVFDQFDPRIDKLFLVSQINMVTEELRRIAPNGTQPNLNTKIMGAYEIALPSIVEQHKYIAVMDQLRAKMVIEVEQLERLSGLISTLQHQAFRGEL